MSKFDNKLVATHVGQHFTPAQLLEALGPEALDNSRRNTLAREGYYPNRFEPGDFVVPLFTIEATQTGVFVVQVDDHNLDCGDLRDANREYSNYLPVLQGNGYRNAPFCAFRYVKVARSEAQTAVYPNPEI